MSWGTLLPPLQGCRYERGKHLSFTRKYLTQSIFDCECSDCMDAVHHGIVRSTPTEPKALERWKLLQDEK